MIVNKTKYMLVHKPGGIIQGFQKYHYFIRDNSQVLTFIVHIITLLTVTCW